MTMYGTALPRGEYERQHERPRSVIGELTTSIAGNVVLRVGHENEFAGGTWELTEHVVLTRDEARALAARLESIAGEPDEEPEPEPHHHSDLLPMPGDR